MPKVSLFIPCFVDQFSPQVGMDVVRVLRRIGYEVDFPEAQTCCGQPAFNTGYWDEARPLAERFVRIFSSAEVVVSPSGSCTTMVQGLLPGAARRELRCTTMPSSWASACMSSRNSW